MKPKDGNFQHLERVTGISAKTFCECPWVLWHHIPHRERFLRQVVQGNVTAFRFFAAHYSGAVFLGSLTVRHASDHFVLIGSYLSYIDPPIPASVYFVRRDVHDSDDRLICLNPNTAETYINYSVEDILNDPSYAFPDKKTHQEYIDLLLCNPNKHYTTQQYIRISAHTYIHAQVDAIAEGNTVYSAYTPLSRAISIEKTA